MRLLQRGLESLFWNLISKKSNKWKCSSCDLVFNKEMRMLVMRFGFNTNLRFHWKAQLEISSGIEPDEADWELGFAYYQKGGRILEKARSM